FDCDWSSDVCSSDLSTRNASSAAPRERFDMSFTPLIFANEKDLLADAPKSRVPWAFAISCCVYYLLAGRGLAAAVPVFAKLFHGLGIPIPFPTRFLVASYSWIFPVVF